MEEKNTVQPDIKVSAEEPKKNNTLLVILLIVLFFITSGIAVYALYQNNQLKKQTTQLETQLNQNLSTPNQHPSPKSKLPTDTIPTSSANLTENWKTYENKKYGYSLKNPRDWGEYSMSDFSFSPTISENQYLYLGPKESVKKPPQSMEIEVIEEKIYEQRKESGMQPESLKCSENEVRIGKNDILATKTFCQGWHRGPSFKIEKNNYVYLIDNVIENSSNWQTFDFILSTFKFISKNNK